jgi:hypothetical protein
MRKWARRKPEMAALIAVSSVALALFTVVLVISYLRVSRANQDLEETITQLQRCGDVRQFALHGRSWILARLLQGWLLGRQLAQLVVDQPPHCLRIPWPLGTGFG